LAPASASDALPDLLIANFFSASSGTLSWVVPTSLISNGRGRVVVELISRETDLRLQLNSYRVNNTIFDPEFHAALAS
jgi:hypothetical protein